MKQMTFSNEQNTAITTVDGNVLISAGAGSGKTTVLAERIYQLLKSGHRISRFLVLTFTDAASKEMKSRIRGKIVDDESLKSMVSEVENAHIETFDAFANFIVKKYVESDFSIVDDTVLQIEQHRIIENLLNVEYQKKDPIFIGIIKNYCTKNDDRIYAVINSILHVANLKIDKEKYYGDLINNFYQLDTIKQFIDTEYKQMIKDASEVRPIAENFACLDDANNVCAFIDGLLATKNYDECREYIINTKYENKKPKGETDKDEFNAVKEVLLSYRKYDYGDSDFIIKTFLEKKEEILYLVNIAKDVDEQLHTFQKEHKSYTFNDIARMALVALQDPHNQKEMRDSFDYILVDEYQDTSDIQEEVIKCLSNNNVCMVGDIKQSIYAFRNANCQIFQEKYDNYSLGRGGRKINLNDNYRSREEIVNLINELYSELMVPSTNPINYKDGHFFNFGYKDYSSHEDNHEKYDFKAYTYSYEKSEDALNAELEIVADDIISKINSGYQVYDKKNGCLKQCSFNDFAILIDRGTSFDEYREFFSKKNIPIHVVADETIRDSDTSYVCKNLLVLFYCLSHNQLDSKFAHAYCSIARSFLMEMSDQDLFTVVSNKLYPNTPINQKVSKVIEKYRYSSNYEILDNLLTEFSFYEKVVKIGNFSSNCHKAEIFLSIIKSMDELGYSLAQVVEYFENLSDYDLEIKYSANDSVEDSVTLMTMHKSKGLEFPFVYLAGLNKQFNNQDMRSNIVATNNYGVLLPITESTKYCSLLAHLYRQEETHKSYEEKIRLIYVAMTRAKERLIVLLGLKEKTKSLIDITKANSFADMLLNTPSFLKYIQPYQMKNTSLLPKTTQYEGKNIVFKAVSVTSNLVERKKASKEKDIEIPQSLLDFGNELHYLLEVVNYETKDVSFIKDYRLKKYVLNVLNSKLFDGVKNEQIRHEYQFYDDMQGVNGIIDALVVLENEVRIIDFKLKNIDDEHYDEQLKVYRNYIKTITDKPIKLYLISSITGEVREIE